jgi:hypothetical protein
MAEGLPLEFIITERARVIHRACQLLPAIERNEKRILEETNLEDVAGLLMGAAFSLWRAIFLAPELPNKSENMIRKGRDFLEKYLRDNFITYGDDKKHHPWTYGYYLNSARFRLRLVKEIQSSLEGYEWL